MPSRTLRLVPALLFLTGVAPTAPAAELVLPRLSPKAGVTQTLGLTDISIAYSRPGVKGRTIWGDLVPYDKVWRTGANEATVVTFSRDVEVQGTAVPAGSYSIHTIPTPGDWTVILNKDADQWGSYSYNAERDALRIVVKPRPAEHQEWLEFSFPVLGSDTAELTLRWEKLALAIPIQTAVAEHGFASIEKAVEAARSDTWRIPYRAADFAFNQGTRLDDAAKWIEQSLAAEENFFNLSLKARMLAKQGQTAAAIPIAEKAIRIAKEKNSPPDTASLDRPLAEWKKGKS